MKIGQKLILGFTIVVLLMAAVISFSIAQTKNALQEAIGEHSVFLSREIIERLDRNVYREIKHWKFVSTSSRMLHKAVLSSNQKFDTMPSPQEYIEEIDKKWKLAEKETITPFIEELTNNKLSQLFRIQSDYYKKEYGYEFIGEIFATNKYGVNVGQTQKTSDYYQADEEWWQKAKKDGTYVRDVKYDESAGMYAVDICVRIDDKDGNLQRAKITENGILTERFTYLQDYVDGKE